MHTHTLHGYCGNGRNRRQVYLARRLGLTQAQQIKLDTLDGEVDEIAAPMSEFLDSLDGTQRATVRSVLRRRLT